ncbi:MAG: cation-translocating P-type ATPase, partial [bacterium]
MAVEREYYLLNREELINQFDLSLERGLTSREARRRQYEYGRNQLVETNSKNFFTIFFDQFKDFMIIVLMIATCLSFLMGEFSDGFTIFAIIILNGIMGFIQEYRAEKSLAELKKLAAPLAKVLRDGQIDEISSEELVPGDILLLETGDKIPADARILSARGLQTDESLLTGESVPVSKSEKEIITRGVDVVNQSNMVFMGTSITRGKCRAVVVSTGMETEMGKIAHLLEKDNNRLTPLQKRLKHLGKWLVLLSIIITLAIVIIGVLKGQSTYNMFMAGVSLAVAAIPEGLPAIVTLALAIGVQKMIRSNAIVRKLQAVETLGCSTVICSDKTGTLTENRMTLKKIYIDGKIRDFDSDKKNFLMEKILKIASLCSSVQLKSEERRGTLSKVREFFVGSHIPEMMGDPTEIALVRAYYQIGNYFSDLKNDYQVIGEESFNSERKRMSILVNTNDQRQELWIKGAAEVILDRSSFIEIEGKRIQLSHQQKEKILQATEEMAGEALRVLAVAYRSLRSNTKKDNLERLENELVFLGLVGMIDPPREEAYQAVSSCYQAGIKPIMITGDHSVTARVIAEELGIISKYDKVISGDELKGLGHTEFRRLVNEVKVYARISPADKL